MKDKPKNKMFKVYENEDGTIFFVPERKEVDKQERGDVKIYTSQKEHKDGKKPCNDKTGCHYKTLKEVFMRKIFAILIMVIAMVGITFAGEISAGGSFLRYFGEEMGGRADKFTLGYHFELSSMLDAEVLYSHGEDDIAKSHMMRFRVKEVYEKDSFSWNWGFSFGILKNSFKEGYRGTGPSTKLLGVLVGVEKELSRIILIFAEVEGGYTWQELYKGGYYFPALGFKIKL